MANFRILFTIAVVSLLWSSSATFSQGAGKSNSGSAEPRPTISSGGTSAAARQPSRPPVKESAFKDDATVDFLDKEVDRKIKGICRGC